MALSCAEITQRYVATLTEGFQCQTLESRIRITTPYLYPDNDLIDVYIEELSPARIRVTDLGETLRHLQIQGFDISGTPKRRYMVDTIAAGTGVEAVRGELVKEGTTHELGELLFDVIAAARGVSDLIYTSRTYEPAVFTEEVGRFLQENGVKYETRARLTGGTGKVYTVDFRLVETNRYVETLSPRQVAGLQPVVNRVFRLWFDCNGQLGPKAKVSLLNDIDFAWRQPEVALLGRVSTVAYWSRRDDLLPLLTDRNPSR
ncbi:MAG: hypothetical protein A2148_00700 [Chloroflexi bacterium RBG_16_68_14]|nr:MAG: hypothetical protein A2148_00700 [Chloroflexi bacterium RBG_16_68_14]